MHLVAGWLPGHFQTAVKLCHHTTLVRVEDRQSRCSWFESSPSIAANHLI